MKEPLVSIIVPVLRPVPNYLVQAIESLVRQTLDDIEILVIEDPSESDAADTLSRFDHPAIRHVKNPSATGLSRQHNLGMELARGLYLSRFDSDDVCEPEKLALQVELLEAHPEIDVVGTNLLVIDEEDRVIGERHYPADHDSIMRTFPLSNPIANPTILFRRELIDRFGGWREDATDPAQDYEWFSRLARGGARFANLQRPLVRYRVHPRTIKRTKLRGTLRTTIAVKKEYWRDGLGVRGRLTLWMEQLLLLLPSALVYRAFLRLRYGGGSGPGGSRS
jgi:glycosyltransferase involved in cell wall biosynthesis